VRAESAINNSFDICFGVSNEKGRALITFIIQNCKSSMDPFSEKSNVESRRVRESAESHDRASVLICSDRDWKIEVFLNVAKFRNLLKSCHESLDSRRNYDPCVSPRFPMADSEVEVFVQRWTAFSVSELSAMRQSIIQVHNPDTCTRYANVYVRRFLKKCDFHTSSLVFRHEQATKSQIFLSFGAARDRFRSRIPEDGLCRDKAGELWVLFDVRMRKLVKRKILQQSLCGNEKLHGRDSSRSRRSIRSECWDGFVSFIALKPTRDIIEFIVLNLRLLDLANDAFRSPIFCVHQFPSTIGVRIGTSVDS